MRDTTLCFLVENFDNQITSILLAMKKRGFGANWFNGVGGKTNENESILDAACRETFEEISVMVNPNDLKKVATIKFEFADNPEWNQTMHVFFIEVWEGEPVESEEMKPEWFSTDSLPLDQMWPDDQFWLPKVIQGKKIEAYFKLDKNNNILEQQINEIQILV
ncbi:MAG: 8-oxo-dGTP diphosphatase [Ignavibacteriaceae bacterium]|nr:8-oxo-dGTP diphosphatase [Ignavibacteriaceae bacterium]